MMHTRILNVTATDGQHFSDVTPIELKFHNNAQKNRHNWNNNGVNFECRETDVAARLTQLMAKADRNNIIAVSDTEDFHLSSSAALPSRFGANVHQPEIRDLPVEMTVKETAQVGSKLITVRLCFFFI